VLFCGIPHHNYHCNITVPAKYPLLRLKIIKNIIGSKKKVCRQLSSSSSSRIRMKLQFHPDPAAAARKLSTNLYDI
jgi:hypothetical protein